MKLLNEIRVHICASESESRLVIVSFLITVPTSVKRASFISIAQPDVYSSVYPWMINFVSRLAEKYDLVIDEDEERSSCWPEFLLFLV